MEIAVKTRFLLGLNPQIACQCKSPDLLMRGSYPSSACFPVQTKFICQRFPERKSTSCYVDAYKPSHIVQSVSSSLESISAPASSFDGFTVTDNASKDNREIKMRIDVSGAKTQVIYDDVFSKLVAAAQPIPGFRRIKGGKTPDIPKDILLHIIGHSKVNKEAIKKIINTTVAEFVNKEGLKVTKDLKVEQSIEDLEATFEPGKEFGFDAIIQLQK
ncbi:hypothetical protein QJS10_CPB04g01886 [Acorus calamus]|uniref:peptidylprolyl isomerase n=1 Tax=Acorus calamus TaxID=4465 RepID=A0AAV9EZK2_ACOCL|nr:hypothetical protein QJS10_CPB04g01886 [Acorus calamus]